MVAVIIVIVAVIIVKAVIIIVINANIVVIIVVIIIIKAGIKTAIIPITTTPIIKPPSTFSKFFTITASLTHAKQISPPQPLNINSPQHPLN